MRLLSSSEYAKGGHFATRQSCSISNVVPPPQCCSTLFHIGMAWAISPTTSMLITGHLFKHTATICSTEQEHQKGSAMSGGRTHDKGYEYFVSKMLVPFSTSTTIPLIIETRVLNNNNSNNEAYIEQRRSVAAVGVTDARLKICRARREWSQKREASSRLHPVNEPILIETKI